MAFSCPAGTICPNNPSVSYVDGKPYYTITSTKVVQDSNGKVSGSETTVYYSQTPNDFVPAARTTDGAATWNFLTYQSGQTLPNGKQVGDTILGAGLQRSLQKGELKTNTNNAINEAAKRAGISTPEAKNLTLSNNTKAVTDPNAVGVSTSSAGEVKEKDLLTASGQAKGRNKFPSDLTYPLSLRDSKQDKIKFEMLEYKPSTFNKSQFGFDRPTIDRTAIGSVYLPIPAGISDTTGAKWGEDEMGPGKIAASKIALGGITGGGAGFTKAMEDVVGSVSGASGEVKTAVAGYIAGEASGAGSGLLTRITGAVLNPNLELLFGGPTLRPFNFTFKMSARSEDEAKQIIGIIRFFKQGMAPQKSTSNLFVKAPHTFRIRYILGKDNKDHPFLNKFKECALQNLTVDYTPEGNYATFYDGPMISYQITMQFQELEPVFNSDYGEGTGSNGPDTELGF